LTAGDPGVIDVLVVDDSAVVRQLLTALLGAGAGIRVSTASDPLVAIAKMRRHRPHVILLDLELPRMDGLTFLKQIMATDPVPVVVCSGFAGPGTQLAVRALAAGAVDIFPKPRIRASNGAEDHGLLEVVRAAAQSKVGPPRAPRSATFPALDLPSSGSKAAQRPPARAAATGSRRVAPDPVIAMGASTGGTEALRDILRALPTDAPGIVIVQHMPAGFTAAFAEHLNGICQIEVREAAEGDRVVRGLALVARGDRHLLVRRRAFELVVELSDAPPVSRHRPSVDVLFRSVAEAAGASAVGVILTGMGVDGADGLFAMKQAGAVTIAQDEGTSIVFGMPKEAIERGAADVVLPLPRIASGILHRIPGIARSGAADAGR
jgi:two-component system, chemotaxis family, protein-glutamate methylesterase/glutaminase